MPYCLNGFILISGFVYFFQVSPYIAIELIKRLATATAYYSQMSILDSPVLMTHQPHAVGAIYFHAMFHFIQ
jgi:hypothetical protein